MQNTKDKSLKNSQPLVLTLGTIKFAHTFLDEHRQTLQHKTARVSVRRCLVLLFNGIVASTKLSAGNSMLEVEDRNEKRLLIHEYPLQRALKITRNTRIFSLSVEAVMNLHDL